jgi:hypothetical protein
MNRSSVSGRRPRRIRTIGRVVGLATLLLAGWVTLSLANPRRADLRSFDAPTVGRLDAAMWRSYYEQKRLRLFWQLAQSLREQFHTGFVRSFPSAYRAAKAAFVFKDGRNRDDYAKALPDLERYFESINAIAAEPFDVKTVAKNELEWWIVRREPKRFTTKDWERLIAVVAADIYHVPAERLAEYARLRVEAMVLRDARGQSITEEDWAAITSLLEQSWSSLAEAVSRTPGSVPTS